MSADGSGVRVSIEGRVARITIDNPPVNAFSFRMAADLLDALGAVEVSDAGLLVLTGAGERAFSAGMDLRERLTIGGEEHVRRTRTVRRAVAALRDFPLPTLAVLNAPAVGLGVALALACDLRLASDTATFSMPEIDRGTVADGGLSLREIGVPAGVVRFMLLTGQALTAEHALRVHLVDDVAAAGTLVERAEALATAIVDRPTTRLIAMKAAIRAADRAFVTGDTAAAEISEIGAGVARGEDALTGIATYLADSVERPADVAGSNATSLDEQAITPAT